jgi:hypothetical protein
MFPGADPGNSERGGRDSFGKTLILIGGKSMKYKWTISKKVKILFKTSLKKMFKLL